MFEYHSSALIYMPQYRNPEDSTDEAVYIQNMVIEASRRIREKRSSLLVLMSDSVPEDTRRNLKTGTPSLQETFKFETPKERALFLVNSADKTVINFPLAIN